MSGKKKNPHISFWKATAVVMAILFLDALLKYSSGLGKNNSAEKIITEYASQNGFTLDDYPDEIRNMLVRNDETKQFVTEYPKKITNFKPQKIDLSEYKDCTEPPHLMQWDMRWGYMTYNGNAFGITGSAPTCLSMVAIYVLHNTEITPVFVAEYAKGSNCEGRPEVLLSSGARAMKMNVSEVMRNNQRLREAVTDNGCAVICMLKDQELSQFIVIKGIDKEGHFIVMDPFSKKLSEKGYTFADLNKSIKRIWKYSPLPTVTSDTPQ